ncbi:L,D-transpeptidase family protein [Streptomyces sp. NPDC058451]|uniref:L,D-transpeptidase family protein n=1 Tax=unclassified Streptomyces TaxID=2593676 RepID=UPI00364BEB50
MASSTRRPSRRQLPRAPFGDHRAVTSTPAVPNRPGIPAAVLLLSLTLAGCAGPGADADPAGALDAPTAAPATAQAAQAMPTTGTASAGNEASATALLPGLGPRTLAEIPANTRQVVLVTGQDKNSPTSEVILYRRTGAGWTPGTPWPAHNALKGWTDDHHLNDLRSPIGVFSLTDAGGLLPDPGARLPYDQSHGFTISGTGFDGEPLSGAFDYVVAINYNHEPGTSPLDWTRPLGADKGGGIWLHVDHGGPTHACVSLKQEHMKELLLRLDPAEHPVIVMGDAASLTR